MVGLSRNRGNSSGSGMGRGTVAIGRDADTVRGGFDGFSRCSADHGLTLPRSAPTRQRGSSSSRSSRPQSPSCNLVDEAEEEGEDEDEEGVEATETAVEGDEGTDRSSESALVASRTIAHRSGTKRKAYIRPGTIDVLEPLGPCSRWITKKFKENFDKDFSTWGKMTIEQKNGYFEEFKGFEWDESKESAIRAGWNKKAARQYAQLTCRARKNEKRPSFLLDEVWHQWSENWEDPKFKECSARIKSNRGRASTHTGESRSFANTADFLKKTLKVDEIPAHQLFQHNHSRGHDMQTWVSSKAMSVERAYQREIATNAENGTPIDENEAYLKAAGGISKSDVYDVGDQRTFYYDSSSSSSVRSDCSSGRSLISEVKQLRKELEVAKREREAIQRRMQVLLQKMMIHMHSSSASEAAEGNESAQNASD